MIVHDVLEFSLILIISSFAIRLWGLSVQCESLQLG